MFRLIGFLVGSTIAVTAILVVLGVPEFHFDDGNDDTPPVVAAVDELPPPPQEETPEPDAIQQEIEELPAETVEQARIERQLVTEEALPVVPLQDELHWYSFWNPFRSEIAARGFVSRLENVTGLDYRIVKVKVGVYEVAFAYSTDAERQEKLAQISAATGLDLTGS